MRMFPNAANNLGPQPPRVAFVGWNTFQFLHFRRLIRLFPSAVLVVERRRGGATPAEIRAIVDGHEVFHYSRQQMDRLDGDFDVLVCQTPFHGIGAIRRSKIAMLQYGYAKEGHNFAPWRSFGDLCMTYGNYASRGINPFCPCVATGNPRYEDWNDPDFHTAAIARYAADLDPSKKTLLYAPTWGELSSYFEFADAVSAMRDEFNVVLKIHHNSARFDRTLQERSRRKFDLICGGGEDITALLVVADVLISDFSGAIFDALYNATPVVLLDPAAADVSEPSRSDHYSLERSRRDELGRRVASPGWLRETIHQTFESTSIPTLKSELRTDLFVDAAGATDRAAAAIAALWSGAFSRTQAQEYIRREMAELFRSRSQYRFVHRLFRALRITRGSINHQG